MSLARENVLSAVLDDIVTVVGAVVTVRVFQLRAYYCLKG